MLPPAEAMPLPNCRGSEGPCDALTASSASLPGAIVHATLVSLLDKLHDAARRFSYGHGPLFGRWPWNAVSDTHD